MRAISELTSRPMPLAADRKTGGVLMSVLRFDLPASVVVFLVALPLSLGIAVASGAPALAGLIAAIVGGVVAGSLGGSPLQVSGPAAGLTVIVAGLIAEFGWAVTCAITACAGLLQIVFGLTRVGRAALAISPMVVHAMLAGIGITIALQQVHVLLGGESHSSAWHKLVHLPFRLADANSASMALGLLVIVIMVGWRWAPTPLRMMPGPLMAILAATALSLTLTLDVPRVELNGSLVDAVQLPSLPDGAWGAFVVGVLTVALIASVESLLTAVAVDRMQNRTRSNLDRELLGQGAANVVSGAIGGLPITGVIVRSSANVAAGARTRASSMLHGVWILLFALPFAGLIQQIPTAALAGLLVVIGVQLVKLTHIATARRNGDIAVYLITIVGVVFLNLLEGVLMGLGLSILMTTWRVARAKITAEPVADGDWEVVIQGSCTCLSLPRLHQTLASVPAGSSVNLVMSAHFVDHAAREYIDAWRRQHEAAGGWVHMRHSDNPGAADRGLRERVFREIDPVLAPALRITSPEREGRPAEMPARTVIEVFVTPALRNIAATARLDSTIEAAIARTVQNLRVPSSVGCSDTGCDSVQAPPPDTSSARLQTSADEQLTSWLIQSQHSRAADRVNRNPPVERAASKGSVIADRPAIIKIAV